LFDTLVQWASGTVGCPSINQLKPIDTDSYVKRFPLISTFVDDGEQENTIKERKKKKTNMEYHATLFFRGKHLVK